MTNSRQASAYAGQEKDQRVSMPVDLPIAGASLSDRQIHEVVQNHRRLRPIAPTALSARNSAPQAVTQPNWTAAIQAVFAAWLPYSSNADAVVASAGKSGTRASQTARTSLGRKSRLLWNCQRGQTGKAYRLRLLELSATGKCIISYLPSP